jgi:hypothetical protein
MEPSDLVENRTFDEIAIGDSAFFAVMSGDVNPAIIAHGVWGGALVSAVLGTRLPGPGTIYLGQDLSFRKPVGLGDTITVTATAKEKRPEKHIVVFDCRCVNQRGEEVITGTTVTMAPTKKIRRPRVTLPEVQLRRHDKYQQFMADARLATICYTDRRNQNGFHVGLSVNFGYEAPFQGRGSLIQIKLSQRLYIVQPTDLSGQGSFRIFCSANLY